MKILIIGSEGFIGSNAVKYFISRGFEVFGADIVKQDSYNYTIINPDFPDFASLFNKQLYNVCINASGAADVQYSFKYTAIDYILNVTNVFNILEAIRQYNSECKFINFSSAAVYGNPELLPVKENANLHPLSPYGWHKLYSEQICREFNEYFKIPTLSLRVFSAYGPGLKKQLFWDLYQKSLLSNIINIYGNGKESRDFIYISDIMSCVELAIAKADFKGEAVNVANGEEIFISDIVSNILRL
jgi:UDP-glucose 4-epimerase